MAKRPGRLSGKAARRTSPWNNRRNQIIAGGVAVVIVSAVGLSVALDDSPGETTAQSLPGDKWKESVLFDLSRMSQGSLDYLKQVNDWRDGKIKDPVMDAAATSALDKYLEARELMSVRTAFDPAPRALDNYSDAVEVYIAHARLAKLGATVKDDALKTQIKRAMDRVRYLADRLYDLGGTELAPYSFQLPEISSITLEKPVDVPSFAGSDTAPGAPLAAPKPAAGIERRYQKVRPEQEVGAWIAAVAAAKVPTAEAETKALKDGRIAELGTLADEFTAASDTLYAAADPRGERPLNTRIQIGLLVQSEAMRVGQMATLISGDSRTEANEIARSLALVGNRMWDARLGPRALGFPATLLRERPKVAGPIGEGDFVNPTTGPYSPPPVPIPSGFATPAPTP